MIAGDSKNAKKAAVAPKIAAKTKPVHPTTSEMVTVAIGEMNERNGSSLSAIKKYLAANYMVDSERLAPFIKRFLKKAVLSGEIIQAKGRGAVGSFKLPKIIVKPDPKPKPKSIETKKKPAAPKKVAKKVEEEPPADSKKPKLVSPKKVEKKKVAAKVAKTPARKKAAKPVIAVIATLNTSKVAKPTKAAATKKKAAKKTAKK